MTFDPLFSTVARNLFSEEGERYVCNGTRVCVPEGSQDDMDEERTAQVKNKMIFE